MIQIRQYVDQHNRLRIVRSATVITNPNVIEHLRKCLLVMYLAINAKSSSMLHKLMYAELSNEKGQDQIINEANTCATL